MTGHDLQALLIEKWGYSYDLQFRRTQGKIFLQVMWRYQEQASFPLSEEDYAAHLDRVATYLNGWDQGDYVAQWIRQTREKPRLGKAVSIPLALGEPALLEWLADEF
jgi:hypothetical protein